MIINILASYRLAAMKVLLLLLPFVSAAFAERAQVILLPMFCSHLAFFYLRHMCLLLLLLILHSVTQVKYLGGITFLLRDR